MKPRMTKRSLRFFLAALLGLVLAGLCLTACDPESGNCGRNCIHDCGGSCDKTSGHSGQHHCDFCGWHWY